MRRAAAPRGRMRLAVLLAVMALSLVLWMCPVTLAEPAINSQAPGPGMYPTVATNLNSLGDIVGNYHHGDGKLHGYMLSGGVFTYVDVPDSQQTTALAVNDWGDVAGTYLDATGVQHGYVFSQGIYTTIDIPFCRCDSDPT